MCFAMIFPLKSTWGMKEKEAEFDFYWYCIVFSCWPKQGCEISTCGEIRISEISSTFNPFVKRSAADVLCKDWSFSWACSQHQLSWKMLWVLLGMGAGEKQAEGSVVIKLLFSFLPFLTRIPAPAQQHSKCAHILKGLPWEKSTI